MNKCEKIVFKIWLTILCVVIACTTVHHINGEVYYDRFSAIFVGFIDIYLNGHISLHYFSNAPLFHSNIQVDSSLPCRVQGVALCESYFPNFVSHFLILHYITGLSPQILVILPLGVFFIPIAYLAIIRAYVPIREIYDYIFHILLGIYFIIYLSATKFYGSFYVAPTSLLLALTIFLCIKKSFDEHARSQYYVIICIIMLSLAHTWHSMLMITLFYIIGLWMILAIMLYLFTKFSTGITCTKLSPKKYTSIIIISMIISLTFSHLWQSGYVGLFLTEASFWDFLSKCLIQLFGGVSFPVPYVFNYKDLFFGKVYFISYLFILFFSSLILLIPIILYLLQLKRDSILMDNIHLAYALSIIFAQAINVVAYYKTDSINFPYIVLFFPIFGLGLFTTNMDYRTNLLNNIIAILLIILIISSLFCVVSLSFTNEAAQTSITKYKDTKTSFEWIYYHADKTEGIIVDFNILGKYLSREAKISKPHINYQDLTPEDYGVVVGDVKPTYLGEKYIVIDHATMSKGLPIHSISSRSLLKPELDRINNCSNQNKLYEDSHISIFRIFPQATHPISNIIIM